jgi:hypothetical protein
MDEVDNHIDYLRVRLAKVKEISDKEINQFNIMIDTFIKNTDKVNKLNILHEIINKIKLIINFYTITYFSQKKLNPIPRNYLPDKIHYKIKTINPNYNPKNPVKQIDSDLEDEINMYPETKSSYVETEYRPYTDDQIIKSIKNRLPYKFNAY